MRAAKNFQTAVIFFSKGDKTDFCPPFEPIAGLELLERQLLWLEQHGFSTVDILAPPSMQRALAEKISLWSKSRSLPRVEIHDFSAEGKSVFPEKPKRAIFLDGRFLHHPDLPARALSAEDSFIYIDGRGRFCGLGVADLEPRFDTAALLSLPRVELPDGLFAIEVRNRAEALEAESRLFKSFIKPTDGWFSKHLNRPVSLSISRRIAPFPVHPNLVTLLTLLVGILAGWSAAGGGLFHLAAGGVLFQIASILDGVDGEIARAKLLSSKTGEWLDTVCDDLTNAVFIYGVSLGTYRTTSDLFWLVLGMLSLVIYGITLTVMYGHLIANKRKPTLLSFQEEIRSPGYSPGRIKAFLVALQPFIKRDFYGYAFMITALLGLSKLMIAGWLTGALLTLGFISTEWKSPFSGKAH